jgi:hypothetical protein
MVLQQSESSGDSDKPPRRLRLASDARESTCRGVRCATHDRAQQLQKPSDGGLEGLPLRAARACADVRDLKMTCRRNCVFVLFAIVTAVVQSRLPAPFRWSASDSDLRDLSMRVSRELLARRLPASRLGLRTKSAGSGGHRGRSKVGSSGRGSGPSSPRGARRHCATNALARLRRAACIRAA